MKSMPAASLPVYLGKTESVQVEVSCFMSKTFTCEINNVIIQILQAAAALTNGGATQATGLVSGVSFM